MRLHAALVVVSFLAASMMAHGSTFVIDNFSCADSISQTGFNNTKSEITCPGSLGGSRGDNIFNTNFTGSFTTAENAVSTINSNPPSGEITGTIGTDLVGEDIMTWFGTTTPGVFDLPSLDLSGDSILVQIESDMGGTLTFALASGSVASSNNLTYSTTFAASSSFIDVLIPLTNPTMGGSGADVSDVTAIGLMVGVPGGGSYTIDGVEAVPEPSTLLLTGICFLGILTRSIWRRSSR